MTKSFIATAGILFILAAFIGCSNSTPATKSSEKSITSFSFKQADNANLSVSQVDGVIDEANKTIMLRVSSNASPDWIATFSISAGAKLEVAGVEQKSGITSNNFSSPVTYTVTAEDGTTAEYTVTVSDTPASSEKSITAFSFTQADNANLSTSEVDGVINETGKTIALQVNSSAFPNLIATFSISAGAKLKVNDVEQESGVTSNDFTSPVTYRVTAEDGSTEDYTVTVSAAAPSSEKSITAFSFTQADNANLSTSEVDGVIDETGKTIALQVNSSAFPNLIATFSISAGAKLEVAGVEQESGVTSNDFTNPVTYTVTAEDGSTENYTVTVSAAAPSSEKSITSFSFTQADNANLSTSEVDGVIDETGKTIALQVNSSAFPNLIATFSISAGAKLKVNDVEQESGVTSNDFTNPVTYTVTAEDGTTENYTVTVSAAAPSSEKSITAFSFTQADNANLSASEVDGVIDETGKTIALQVNSSAFPNLIATFSISAGAKLEVAGVEQESGVTSNDFTSPVTYRVTAEDGSTENYTVTVSAAAPSSEKSITAFSFTQADNANLSASEVDGVIDETGKTIALQVNSSAFPNLIATFSISAGAKLKVNDVEQESGVTSNDFTNPVTYTVTAEDGSTEDYTVTVSAAAASSEKSITSFSFTQTDNANLSTSEVDGVIDETGKTIALQVNSSAFPNLIATFSISAGAKLKVNDVEQESGVTSNDFTNPVTYTVTAEDGSTEDYTVTVSDTAASSEKSITAFSFTQTDNANLFTSEVDGVIDETGKTIALQVNSSAFPNLIATFSISAGAKLEVAGVEQKSGVTSNDFTSPVTYRVTAEDGSTEDYTVTVSAAAASSEKSITSFSFTQADNANLSASQVDGVIDETGKTIALQVNSSAFPHLIAAFSISAGAKLEVAGVEQESGVTSNDFTSPVTYTVTAEDGSTAEYIVSVTSATATVPGSPSSPAGITGAKTGTGAGTVTIIWDSPADPGSGNDGNAAAITKYKLYRSKTSGFALTDASVTPTEITDATRREFEVSGLAAASTEYYFRLTAFNSNGEGPPTDEFSAFTPTDGLAFALINSDAEYSVAKGTVSNTATAIAVPAYYEGKKVTEVAPEAFRDFAILVSIQLPGELKTIGNYAFSGCSSLALTSLPAGVTSIEQYAFSNCNKLALTSLPTGLTTIEKAAFQNCSSLVLSSLPAGVTSIGQYAFYNCSNLALTSLPAGVTSIGQYAFSGCSKLALTSLPAGLTSIEDSVFSSCGKLALTSLPAGVTSIGRSAFRGSSLTLTSLPDGITSIESFAFQYCGKLALTSLPDGLTSIGQFAFDGCSKLALTSLPAGLEHIQKGAFRSCTALTEITIDRSIPPTAGIAIFEHCTSLTKIKVPAANEDDYKTADGWNTYADKIESI